MTEIKAKRIGAKPGPKPHGSRAKIAVTYRLDPDVVEFLRRYDRPASQLIEEAIRKVNM